MGWEDATTANGALFTDNNLILNDEVSKNFEYKHLLAKMVARFCPAIMPLSYAVNDANHEEIFAKMIYEHYFLNNQYVKEVAGLKWILKPSMLNNGDEIHLFNNVEELKRHYANPKRLGGDHVIQQYIPNPALIEGRKYTFRIHAVLTNYAGVFFYKQGYVNISAHRFDLEDGFKNRKVHITNYVLDGEFANIEQRSTNTIENFEQIYQKMTDIVRQAMQAILKIEPNYLAPQATKKFEIFGFDFMLDQNNKVWLLEINQSPDAPTFEENALKERMWDVFWQDIIDDFVLPISLNIPPKRAYQHFTQVMSAKETYSSWRSLFKTLTRRS